MLTNIYIYINNLCVCIYIYYIYIYMYIICVCIYIYILCVFIYIYIYIHTYISPIFNKHLGNLTIPVSTSVAPRHVSAPSSAWARHRGPGRARWDLRGPNLRPRCLPAAGNPWKIHGKIHGICYFYMVKKSCDGKK